MEQNVRRLGGTRVLALSLLAALVGPLGLMREAWAQGPTVTVTMTPDKERVLPDQILVYNLRVRNNGPSTANNVILTASPAQHAEYVPQSTLINDTPVPDVAGASPLFKGVNLGQLAPGAVATAVYCVLPTSAFGAGPGCPVKARASVRADGSPPHTPGLTQTPVLPGKPLLEVSKVVDQAAAIPGTILSYRIAVKNAGTSIATNVVVRDPLPPTVEYIPGTTTVFDRNVPDVNGTTPLLSGVRVGNLMPNNFPIFITVQVRMKNTLTPGTTVDNIARSTFPDNPQDTPSNKTTTVVVPKPNTPPGGGNPPPGPPVIVPGLPVPNEIIPVPEGGKKIVTGKPKNIVPCEPTQADLCLSTTPDTPDAWLEVVGTQVKGTSTVFPNLGSDVGERFSKLGLIAPGVSTCYAGTFMLSGDSATFFTALSPRALSHMMLQVWTKELALNMELQPPTADQTVNMLKEIASVPSLQTAIGRFTAIRLSAGTARIRQTSSDPDNLLPRIDAAAIQASADILKILGTSELETLRLLLEKHLAQPVSTNPLRQAIQQTAPPKTLVTPGVRGQIFLLLPTQRQPLDVAFVAAKTPATTAGRR
jgi:uncharacterized repeat protein (TIGR01451 family)